MKVIFCQFTVPVLHDERNGGGGGGGKNSHYQTGERNTTTSSSGPLVSVNTDSAKWKIVFFFFLTPD